MDLLSTIAGSLMEGFFPAGWDLKKIDACVDPDPARLTTRQPAWHKDFQPVVCQSLADFETLMGHEIALTIKRSRDAGEKLALILPVGPMGMYRWVVYFLSEWGVSCDYAHGFNMDEWSDAAGNSLPASHPGSFDHALEAIGALLLPVDARKRFLERGEHRILHAIGARGGEAFDHHRLKPLDHHAAAHLHGRRDTELVAGNLGNKA